MRTRYLLAVTLLLLALVAPGQASNIFNPATGGGGGGAPDNAQYWVGAADATLSAEKNLGALGTGLVINTAGVPSIKSANTCTNQFPRSDNASGAWTCATVSLTADVTGDLPFSNIAQASAASKLLGRGDSGAGDFQEISLGSGLSMSGTTLSASGGSGSIVRVQTSGVSSTDAVNWTDVTGLTWSVTSGTDSSFTCQIMYTTAATTTAIHISMNGPSITDLRYCNLDNTSATATHASCQTAYDTVTNPNTAGGATALLFTLAGTLTPSANGTLAVRLKTEVGGSAANVLRGSFCTIF